MEQSLYDIGYSSFTFVFDSLHTCGTECEERMSITFSRIGFSKKNAFETEYVGCYIWNTKNDYDRRVIGNWRS